MVVFARLINAIGHFFRTLSTLVTVGILLALVLVISVFTPVFSAAILWMLNQVTLPNAATLTRQPSAIAVLGGGLTNDQQNNIIINQYTKARLAMAKQVYGEQQLPIIVSGKEAPWMMRWLQRQGIFWVIPENHSFNTCENAKFTAQTVHVNQIILVTDAYHMNRARRQFALYGIATQPQIAPLPQPTGWYAPEQNLKHSRRALYELLAFIRDLVQPQVDCEPTKKQLNLSG